MPQSQSPSVPGGEQDLREAAALGSLSPEFLARILAVPIGHSEGRLVFAMAEPGNVDALAALRFATGRDIVPVAMDAAEIRKLLAEPGSRAAGKDERAGKASSSSAPSIRIEHSGCTLLRADGSEVRFTRDDDRQVWRLLTPELKAQGPIEVIVPDWASMQIGLPSFPQNARLLREQIISLAPVVVSDLAWAQPQMGEDGKAAVSVVRRAWLDERLGAIERASGLTLRAVTAASRQPLLYAPPRRRQRSRAVAGVMAAVLVAALLASWTMSRPGPVIAQRGPVTSQSGAEKAAPPIAVPPNSAVVRDPPAIVGIVGRLPDGAEVLVRTAPGQTSSVRIGETVLGWKLAEVGADRAVFEMGALRREVVLKPVPIPRRWNRF